MVPSRRMRKLLFVNHSLKLGGSTRSLRELIRNSDLSCDLVVPRDEKSMDEPAMREYFGPNVQQIIRYWLPFELCYRGRDPLWKGGYRWAGLALLWRLERVRFYEFARAYDAIHLNSVVLHPM